MTGMSGDPLVSTRISLAWPPALPSELTSTLVLTGRTGAFVDLRIFTNGDHIGQIDWATAGLKTWLPDSTPVPYEEVWRRLPLPPVATVRATFLRAGDAFIARVGDYQLGIAKGAEKSGFLARSMERKTEGGEWEEVSVVGGERARTELPLAPDGFQGKEGDAVTIGGIEWVVLENS
ncbi:hypothetical protein RQP46_011193 [Phenoliferia psychrophenolica]